MFLTCPLVPDDTVLMVGRPTHVQTPRNGKGKLGFSSSSVLPSVPVHLKSSRENCFGEALAEAVYGRGSLLPGLPGEASLYFRAASSGTAITGDAYMERTCSFVLSWRVGDSLPSWGKTKR